MKGKTLCTNVSADDTITKIGREIYYDLLY